MAPVSRHPATRNHPSSSQDMELENFPLLQLDQDNDKERHVLTQIEEYGRVNVSYSANDCTPQLDNPSAIMPDNEDDYVLKEYMASQEASNRKDQEQFKNDLENEFQLQFNDDESTVNEEQEPSVDNNNITYTQGAFEAASVLASGFFPPSSNNNNSVAYSGNDVADSSGGRPCPGLIGRDSDGNMVFEDGDGDEPSAVPSVATKPNSDIAKELANQMRAHGFCGLSEEDNNHIENSKNEGKNSSKYNNTQETLEKRFMDTLTMYGGIDLLKSLGKEMVPNPNDLSEDSPVDFKFYSVVGGPKNADKHKIMNDCLVLCAMKWINQTGKNKGKQHEPSTFAKYMDQLSCYVFKEKGILYSYSNDFNKKGQFHGILKKKWADVRKANPKFGTAPNKARVEQALVRKFVTAIRNGDIRPYENSEHLCLCVIFILGFY